MSPEELQQFLEMGRAFLGSQPFSQLLGAELEALRPGHCRLALALADKLTQQDGFAHDGVVGYLADTALTYAGGTAMRAPVVSAEFKINHLRPAQGQRLVARADIVHVGKQQSVCRCDVFVVDSGRETLCAVAQGTIARQGDAPPTSNQAT